jgi:GntR family transcriptional regulator, transcriptional repressor for pyruvate dehydrogenase complex
MNRVYPPVRSRRLYESVVDHIQALVAERHLVPGDRLPNERELAAQFEVSRTVVREALKTLVDRGLIEVRSGHGAFVVDGVPNALAQSFELMMRMGGDGDPSGDLVEVRELIEPEIAYRAALRATRADLEALGRAVATMDDHLDDLGAYITADEAFHLCLAEATHNLFLPRLLHSVVDVLADLRGRIFQVDGGPERGQVHHHRILRAVDERAPEAAREAMRAHLRQVREDSRRAAPAPTQEVEPT